jgi:hypothetical protein
MYFRGGNSVLTRFSAAPFEYGAVRARCQSWIPAVVALLYDTMPFARSPAERVIRYWKKGINGNCAAVVTSQASPFLHSRP